MVQRDATVAFINIDISIKSVRVRPIVGLASVGRRE